MLCQGLRDIVDLQVVVADVGRTEVREVVEGVSVQRLGTVVKLASAPFCRGLRRTMREARADIIHLHVPHPTALLTWLVSGAQGKLVVGYHSDIIRQRVSGKLIGPWQDLAYARAAAILGASPGIIAASPVLARHRERCVLVPYGLDLTRFGLIDPEAVAAVRRRFCGKAVINTQIEGSGVPFVSRDGESGLTVPPADTDALTTALMRLLGDDALRSRFGRAGRQRVEEEFTSQRMVDRTLEVYRSVVDAPT
jgi:glycosyltransferase involved in cell wall biosynthesis